MYALAAEFFQTHPEWLPGDIGGGRRIAHLPAPFAVVWFGRRPDNQRRVRVYRWIEPCARQGQVDRAIAKQLARLGAGIIGLVVSVDRGTPVAMEGDAGLADEWIATRAGTNERADVWRAASFSARHAGHARTYTEEGTWNR